MAMLLFACRRKKKKRKRKKRAVRQEKERREINKQMETKIENGDGRDRLRSDEEKLRQSYVVKK